MDRRTVLIIDGPHRLVEIWTAVLSAHGYRVIIAVDGAEALWLLSGEHPDLIVGDVAQEYHGRPLLRALRQTPATRQIPILAIETEGATHGLPDPMTPERILRKVEQLIGSPERRP